MPMSEMEYFNMEEQQAIGQIIAACAKAILEAHDADTMGALQRTIYKYTDCGAAVSFELHHSDDEPDSFEAPIGLTEPAKPSPYVYCGDDRAYEIKDPWNHIRKIGVSSIVEGVDQEVELEWIDLEQYADDDKYEGDLEDLAKIAVKDFDALVERVEKAADEIWKATHGCATCAKHFGNCGEYGTCEGDDGMTPIWDECPDCGGGGSII